MIVKPTLLAENEFLAIEALDNITNQEAVIEVKSLSDIPNMRVVNENGEVVFLNVKSKKTINDYRRGYWTDNYVTPHIRWFHNNRKPCADFALDAINRHIWPSKDHPVINGNSDRTKMDAVLSHEFDMVHRRSAMYSLANRNPFVLYLPGGITLKRANNNALLNTGEYMYKRDLNNTHFAVFATHQNMCFVVEARVPKHFFQGDIRFTCMLDKEAILREVAQYFQHNFGVVSLHGWTFHEVTHDVGFRSDQKIEPPKPDIYFDCAQ